MSKQEEQIEGTQNTQDGAELSDEDLEQAAGGCYWQGGVSIPKPILKKPPEVMPMPPDDQPVLYGDSGNGDNA